MLEIRPSCECCDRDLAPDSLDVLICTYECTWCRDCADHVLRGVCPNCGGELVRRPVPSASRLANDPPSTVRVFNPELLAPRDLQKGATWEELRVYLDRRWGPASEVVGGFLVHDGDEVRVHVTPAEWSLAADCPTPTDDIDEMIGSRSGAEDHIVFFDGGFHRSIRAELPPVRDPELGAPREPVPGGRWYAESPDGTRHYFDEADLADGDA